MSSRRCGTARRPPRDAPALRPRTQRRQPHRRPAAAAAPAAARTAGARGPRRPPAALPAGAPITFPEGADEVLLPMTQMRKGIAAQMTRALAGAARVRPHGGGRDRASCARARRPSATTRRARASSLSYVPFVVKAAVEALQAPPVVQRPLDRRRPRSPSAGSTWASRSPSTTGFSCRSSATSTSSASAASTGAIADVAARARAGKLRIDDFGGTHVHDRQHRLVRLEPDDADHQRARGRDPDHGGDHEASRRASRRRKATSSPSARS